MNCAECKEILFAYLEGLLAEDQKQAVTDHLKDCHTCQAEVKQLTNLQERLVSNGRVVAQKDLENDVMNLIVREQNVRLKAAQKATAGLKLRRIIMKSSVTRIAVAAAVLVVAALGVNYMMAPSVTFADVIKPILNARTVILDLIIGDEETNPLMHEIVVGSRIRRTLSNMEHVTQIIDLDEAKMLALDDKEKTAIYVDMQGPLVEGSRIYVEFLQKVVVKLQDNYEELGEQEIDGQKAIGFAARGPDNEEVKIWADPKTALPVRVELRIGQFFAIMKNFQFDVPIKDSLVSMEVPPGYALQETEFDLSKATEQDFIEGLRIWTRVYDGRFPEALSTEFIMKQVPMFSEKLDQLNLPEEETGRMMMTFVRGMLFLQILERQISFQYAGNGVKLGEADKAIFWYQPEGSKSWRIIYGDLRVEDVSPENLPK
ncbi:MAG TPA: zf-HC2 domain-containing protein [Sedimentisphaerales bacterium]|nr:zf-HC2 domain-containing protein [Sedimentisphaerales bacterium]